MRQRKRAHWSIRVYKYWVCLEQQTWEQLPASVRQEAEAMRLLWNQLVDAFERRQTEYWELVSQFPQAVDLQEQRVVLQHQLRQVDAALQAARWQLHRRAHPQLTQLREGKTQAQQALQEVQTTLRAVQRIAAQEVRPGLRQVHQRFLTTIRFLAVKSTATWANRECVLNHFLAAVERFLKKQSRPPKRKLEVWQEVRFYHRFTDGGLPVDRIFGRSQRLHLEPVPVPADDTTLSQRQRKRLARTVGTFQVGAATLPFRTVLYRALPEGAYLKMAALVGKQVLGEGYYQNQQKQNDGHILPACWTWSLHLTVEVPFQGRTVPEAAKPVAALRLSCKQWNDGRLQIGVLTDSLGREDAFFLPEKVLRAWRHRRELQRRTDKLLEDTKVRLRNRACLEKLPLAAQRIFAHVEASSNAGLWRLLRILEETGATGETMELLRCWADQATKLQREARGLEKRYLRHRDWLYRNMAAQWCRLYKQIVIHSTPTEIPSATTEQEAAAYRHLASLARFLCFLKETAIQTGTEIVVATEVATTNLQNQGDMRDSAEFPSAR